MGTKLILVEKTRDEEFKDHDSEWTIAHFKISGTDGPEMKMGDLPLGSVWKRDDGHIFIKIPNSVDERYHTWFSPTLEKGDGSGWHVTGDLPNITVHPSVWCNKPNGWHGWIRDGEITSV